MFYLRKKSNFLRIDKHLKMVAEKSMYKISTTSYIILL